MRSGVIGACYIHAERTFCNYQLLCTVGGLGSAVSLPAGAGGEAPGSSEDPVVYTAKNKSKPALKYSRRCRNSMRYFCLKSTHRYITKCFTYFTYFR